MKLFFTASMVCARCSTHGAAAVQAVDQPREDILLGHVGSAPFVLTDILYDLPGLLRNERLVRILKAELLQTRDAQCASCS